jgi:hypothetical protein
MRFEMTVAIVALVGCGENVPEPAVLAGSSDAAPAALIAASAAGVPTDAGISDPSSADASVPDVWSPLTVMALVDPMNYGAVGDGQADDQPALVSAIAALPAAGGIVYIAAGKKFRKEALLYLKKSHVKFWSPDRQGTIRQTIGGVRRKQSILCDHTDGCGFFGVRFESDAVARFDALEDNQISTVGATNSEVVGCDIAGAAATGIFVYAASKRTYLEGNYVHHTWADTIHITGGSREAWAWDNFFFNEDPSKGDDGIACVTYKVDAPRCGDLEWWHNTHLGNTWGRGYSVVGGDHVDIHHNFARDIAAAGIIVASESSYTTPASDHVTIRNNALLHVADIVGHPGILLSGKNPNAGAITNVVLTDNVVVDTESGQAFRQEGNVINVTNAGLTTAASGLPSPVPTKVGITPKATTIMKTRDASFVAADRRKGLYRIHVRAEPRGNGFQQRFEYVVAGAPADVTHWLSSVAARTAILADGTKGGERFVAVYASSPLVASENLREVAFTELRTGDNDGSLAWLWSLLNAP